MTMMTICVAGRGDGAAAAMESEDHLTLEGNVRSIACVKGVLTKLLVVVVVVVVVRVVVVGVC